MTENPEWGAPGNPATGPVPGASPYPYGYPPGPFPGPYPPPPMPYGDYMLPPAGPRNGLGIASLITGIVALVGSFTIVGGIILGIIAVVLGLFGRARVSRGEADNGGVALAGIAVGAIAVVAGLSFIAIWVGLFKQVGAGDYFDCLQQAGQDRAKVQLCSEEFRSSVENRFSQTQPIG